MLLPLIYILMTVPVKLSWIFEVQDIPRVFVVVVVVVVAAKSVDAATQCSFSATTPKDSLSVVE